MYMYMHIVYTYTCPNDLNSSYGAGALLIITKISRCYFCVPSNVGTLFLWRTYCSEVIKLDSGMRYMYMYMMYVYTH